MRSIPISRCCWATRSASGARGCRSRRGWARSRRSTSSAGMPSKAIVSTAGTTLARSSMKSLRPDSIFSSMLARDLMHERFPPRDRGRGQIRVEHIAMDAVLRVVHLQHAAAGHRIRRLVGIEIPLNPLRSRPSWSLEMYGQRAGFEHGVAARRPPSARRRCRPCDRALLVHLLGDLLELHPIPGVCRSK